MNDAHAFDFIFGRWDVHNHKLRDVTDPECTEWLDFEATCEAFPILDGIGHIDRLYVVDPPDGEPFEGLTLRLFDPAARTWRIWWSSTRAPGRLDPPVVGSIVDGHGVFDCADVLAGRRVVVRYEWDVEPTAPRWQQSFSFDEGTSWQINWVMNLTRCPD